MTRQRISLPVLLAIAVMASACTTLYTGVVTVTQVADTAMKAWADLSNAGKTSPALDAKVVAAHDKYRAACGVAHTALVAYKQSGDPAQYQLALANAKKAANELLDLITPLLLPQKSTELQTKLAKAKVL